MKFNLIDRITELVPGERVSAVKSLSLAEEYLADHFPRFPVMPGVLLCECCFQAGALLVGHHIRSSQRAAGFSPRGGGSSENAATASGTPVITRIKDAKFKKVVRPGDVLDVEVTIDENVNDVYFMTGRLRVGGKLAVRVEFAATLLDA